MCQRLLPPKVCNSSLRTTLEIPSWFNSWGDTHNIHLYHAYVKVFKDLWIQVPVLKLAPKGIFLGPQLRLNLCYELILKTLAEQLKQYSPQAVLY